MQTQIKAILDYICLYANRDSLESQTAWYYRAIGKNNAGAKASRSVLENIYFISEALNLAKNGIYQLFVGGVRHKQTYLSSAEVVRYVLKNCLVVMSEKWDGFTNQKTGESITTLLVALDEVTA